jgi:hypothetical protein
MVLRLPLLRARRNKPKQIFPFRLRLSPFHFFFCFLARRGFRKTRAEHRSLLWASAERKAHHGLNARAKVATSALYEGRVGSFGYAPILENIESV